MFTAVKRYWLAAAVVMSLVGGSLSWSSVAQACTVTTTAPAKPANFTATANDEGIRLQWDAPSMTDMKLEDVGLAYEIWRGVGENATPRLYGTLSEITPVYDAQTGTHKDFPERTDFMDYSYALNKGTTYVYAVAFGRVDNCGGYQAGVQSDLVTVTYE